MTASTLTGLRRERRHKVLAGVCGGLGRWMGVDPVVFRIAFVLLAFTGIGLLLYPLLWVVVPGEGRYEYVPSGGGRRDGRAFRYLAGIGLVALGVWFFVGRFLPTFSFMIGGIFWPVALVALGFFLLSRR